MASKRRKGVCDVCDCWRAIVADGRCTTCYQYRRRNGHDRPEYVIVRHGQRVLDRMMAT